MRILNGALFALAVALTSADDHERVQCYNLCRTVISFSYSTQAPDITTDQMELLPPAEKACAKEQVIKCEEGELCASYIATMVGHMGHQAGAQQYDGEMVMKHHMCKAKTDLTDWNEDAQTEGVAEFAEICNAEKLVLEKENDALTELDNGYLFWDEEVVCTDFETCEKDCVDDEHKIKSGAGSLASSMNMMVFVAGVFYLLPC